MKIAVVSKNPPGVTGVGTTAFNTARMLQKTGNEVFFITSDAVSAEYKSEQIEVITISSLKTCLGLLWSFYLRLPIITRPAGIDPQNIEVIKFAAGLSKSFPEIIKKEQLDAVLFTESFMEAAYWYGDYKCKFVIRFACPMFLFNKLGLSDQPVNRKLKSIDTKTINRADLLYTPTNRMKELAADYYSIHKNKITVIPNPVDTTLFYPAENQTNQPSLIFVGRFSREKGACLLIDIIPELMVKFPDLQFTVIGKSGYNNSQTSLIKILKNKLADKNVIERFTWHEHVNQDKIGDFYRKHSLLVLPSQFDNFSMSLAEAQASGLPVVTTDVGGSKEVIRDKETGSLVKKNSAEDFYKATSELITNHNKRYEMGKKARQWALKHFSFEAIAPKIMTLLEKI